jgi:hypothetical protein
MCERSDIASPFPRRFPCFDTLPAATRLYKRHPITTYHIYINAMALSRLLCSLFSLLLFSSPLIASARNLRSSGQAKPFVSAQGPSDASNFRRSLVEEQYSDIPIDYSAVNMKFIGAGASETQPYSGSKESLWWSGCLSDTPVFVNSVCLLRSKKNDARYVSQITFGFTDGTYQNIGCGDNGQVNGQVQCYWYNRLDDPEPSWDCINIDVAGGERVTQLGFSEYQGHVSLFELQTTKANGVVQSLSWSSSSFQYFNGGGDVQYYSAADLGSGVICGYKAWAGNGE